MKNKEILGLRTETGLSQSRFAEKYGISLRTLQSWEQGWRNPPEYVINMLKRVIAMDYPEQSERR